MTAPTIRPGQVWSHPILPRVTVLAVDRAQVHTDRGRTTCWRLARDYRLVHDTDGSAMSDDDRDVSTPDLWWSANLAEKSGRAIDGLVERTPIECYRQWCRDWHPTPRLPADAIRLVPSAAEPAATGGLVLADREAELLEAKGPCSDAACRLHYAHRGPHDIAKERR